jgi:hypothetical protein
LLSRKQEQEDFRNKIIIMSLPYCHCEPLRKLTIIWLYEWRGNLPLNLHKLVEKIATPVCGLVRNDIPRVTYSVYTNSIVTL